VKGSSGTAVALVSASVSTEALYLLKAVLEGFSVTGAFRVKRADGEQPLAGVPGLALRSERAPNAAGARLLGYEESFDGALQAARQAAVVIVLDDDLEGVTDDLVKGGGNLVYLGTALPEVARSARVVLPVTNVAEEDGSFVNRDGRVQRYLQAKPGPGMARPAWWVLGELAAELGRGEPLGSAAEAFQVLASAERAFEGLSYGRLAFKGVRLEQGTGAAVTA
jgi:NADH-quinone oxidoreductase subunit G